MSSLQPPGSAACPVQALMKQDGKCQPTELSCEPRPSSWGSWDALKKKTAADWSQNHTTAVTWTFICLHTWENIWGTVLSGQTRRRESMANGSAHHNQRNWFGEAEAGRVKWAGSVGQAVFTK